MTSRPILWLRELLILYYQTHHYWLSNINFLVSASFSKFQDFIFCRLINTSKMCLSIQLIEHVQWMNHDWRRKESENTHVGFLFSQKKLDFCDRTWILYICIPTSFNYQICIYFCLVIEFLIETQLNLCHKPINGVFCSITFLKFD